MPDTDISEGHWLVNVSGIPGTFQTITGGDADIPHTKDWDGGSLDPNIFAGKPDVTDVTVGRAYRAPRDQTILRDLRQRIRGGQRLPMTVTATPLNEQMVPIGRAEIYECLLKTVKAPAANANSATPSRLELVLTVRTVS